MTSSFTNLVLAARFLGLLDEQPAWSPDGKKIAFTRAPYASVRNIYTMNIDGSDLRQLSFKYTDASDPSWAPDGLQLVFSASECTYDYYYYYSPQCEVDILLARTDGRLLPSSPVLGQGYNPSWRK